MVKSVAQPPWCYPSVCQPVVPIGSCWLPARIIKRRFCHPPLVRAQFLPPGGPGARPSSPFPSFWRGRAAPIRSCLRPVRTIGRRVTPRPPFRGRFLVTPHRICTGRRGPRLRAARERASPHRRHPLARRANGNHGTAGPAHSVFARAPALLSAGPGRGRWPGYAVDPVGDVTSSEGAE